MRSAVFWCVLLLVACNKSATPPATDAAAPTTAPPPAKPLPKALCDGPGCLPGFRLATLDGKEISTDDLKGKVALVMFWASWCEPCATEGPGIDSVYRKHMPDGFTIVGATRDTADDTALKGFRDHYHLTYPIARSTDEAFSAFGSPPEVPTLLLYGRNGRLRWRGTGALPAEILEGEVVRALGESADSTTGAATKELTFAVVRQLGDPAKVGGFLAKTREAGPTLAFFVGEAPAGVDARVLNALRFDAWAAKSRPKDVVAPAVAVGVEGTRAYSVSQSAGLRIAAVGPGEAAAVTAAVDQARTDGQANVVVVLGGADAKADAAIEAAGPPLELVTLHLDDQGKPVSSERHAIDPATQPEDAAIRGLVHKR